MILEVYVYIFVYIHIYIYSKENAQALVAATREIGLEVSADETKYMVISRDQNA